jgi:ubiquinone/menaquinone biosynthesis C-methylase UbiE
MARNPIGKVIEHFTIKNLRASIKQFIPINKLILDNGSGFRGSWDYSGQKDIFSVDRLYGDDCNKIRFEDNFFDMVVFAGVIQYVEEYTKSIIEIKRVLKNGGMIIMTTVNRDSLLRNLGLITKEPKFGENKIFTIQEIESLLQECGFIIMHKWGADCIPLPTSLCSNICYLARAKKS